VSIGLFNSISKHYAPSPGFFSLPQLSIYYTQCVSKGPFIMPNNWARFRPCGKVSGRSVEGSRRTSVEWRKKRYITGKT